MGLIKNANFIVTTSFHGVAFSIIFKKQFIYVGNMKTKNSRVGSLLDRLNLKNRMVFHSEDIKFPLSEINYKEVDLLLKREREDSHSFLFDSITPGRT